MPPKIVLSRADEARFRTMWSDGVPVDRICVAFKLSHDSANRVRSRLGLPPRTAKTRAARRAPARDPTPEEIAAACVELRAKHLQRRLDEPATRRYRDEEGERGGRVYPCDVFGDYE